MDERLKRWAVAWAIVSSLVAAPLAHAEEAVILPLTINDVARGEVFSLIADDGDVWVETEALAGADVLLGMRGERRRESERELVSLRSLAPEISFEFDLSALELRLTVDPSLLRLLHFTRGVTRPENLETLTGNGGFLNYRATVASFEDLSGIIDAGWSAKGFLLYSSALFDPEGDFLRGTTNLTFDQPGKLRRITLGDSFARTDQLGGSLSLAGVTVSREFLLDPYFVRLPSLGLTGAVTTPSTVEVYLNGALVDRRNLPPGRFEIDQLSLPTGKGAATVVIRDAFGGERMVVEPFYTSPLALEEGLSEYSYSIGFRRRNESTDSFDYDELAGLASHRWGVTKYLTAGYRAEATDDLWSAGGTLAARALVGEVSLHGALSSDGGETGAALGARYGYLTREFAVSVGWTEMSDHYANVSLPASSDRATRRIDFLGSVRRGRLDIGVNGSIEEQRDRGPANRIGVTGGYPILQRGTAFVSVGMAERGGERSAEIGAGINWHLGFRRSANLRLDHRNEETSVRVSAQQSLGREPGWGYRVEAGMSGDDDTSALRVQHQTSKFRFEVDASPSIASDAVNVSAAGGLAWGGGRMYLMRPGQQSYAIVRIPGMEGVRVYVSNIEAGRTDANGELIVTDLIPYYGNRIRIEDSDIPINYRIDRIERVIAPPLRGGVVVEFDVTPAASITGIAQIENRDGSIRVPATGEMTMTGPAATTTISPLGRAGEFYFEGIGPGRYAVEMLDERGMCRTELEIVASDEAIRDVGTVTCKEIRP